MAGNFILKSITQSDLLEAIRFEGITWSETLHHAKDTPIDPSSPNGEQFAGWTDQTRNTLKQALQGNQTITDRSYLPPHRYLEIVPWQSLGKDAQNYVTTAGWGENLIRPDIPGLRLKEMTEDANNQWINERKNDAMVTQLKKGGISIEVYYISGTEMS